MMAYQVTKRLHFSYGHRLLRHPGKCARLHGHNAVAEITCELPQLNADAMVVDFERISRSLEKWIDDVLDHRMILHKDDLLIPALKEWKEDYYETDLDPTAEVIAKIIFDQAKAEKLPVKKITLWETPSASASYEA
jgi:6-pyruvoyltetrahydropterin/6-carboxytetrahydropterin synthase